VCFPGPLLDYSVCQPVVSAVGFGPDYVYPAPLGGSAQYLEPTTMLDLAVVAGATQIAPNFILSEVAQEWKGQWAVVQPHAVQSLQDIRDDAGAVVVNSGYRSPSYNASVGGASSSRHMYGDAFDIVATGLSLAETSDLCYAHGASFVSVYVAHVHCDWRNDSLNAVFYGGATPLMYGVQSTASVRTAILQSADGVWSAPAQGWDEGEPLRQWRAYGSDGRLLASQDSDTFTPVIGAALVEVTVGLELTLRSDI